MASRQCQRCHAARVVLKRPRTGEKLCKACFTRAFEDEAHSCIQEHSMFKKGQRVALAASGGKDSTVLIHVMTRLNERHGYGLDLFLLSADEGITGYRDDSLETVRRNRDVYGLDLRVVSYADLYDGWTMDRVVRKTGLKGNCTYCGVFRRSALERGARLEGADVVATGHNADDVAETVLMNVLRGDTARLGGCVNPITSDASGVAAVPRVKPLLLAYEKEIVLYAFHNKLDYFSTECIYSPNAYRGFAREYIKAIESARPKSIHDVIRGGAGLASFYGRAPATRKAVGSAAPVGAQYRRRQKQRKGKGRATPRRAVECERCGFITSNRLCQACALLESLEEGEGGEGGVVDGALVIGYEDDAARRARGSSGAGGHGGLPATEGARLVPANAPVVSVRGGTGVRGGPDEVLRLSLADKARALSSLSWAEGKAATVRGALSSATPAAQSTDLEEKASEPAQQ